MKTVTKIVPKGDLETLIISRFAEFNRKTSRSRGRQYPADLRDLVCKASASGFSQVDLCKMTGMSRTAVKYTITRAEEKCIPPRRLEVVGVPVQKPSSTNPLIVRLPSGVTIELADVEMLTKALLATLASLEVNHAASC